MSKHCCTYKNSFEKHTLCYHPYLYYCRYHFIIFIVIIITVIIITISTTTMIIIIIIR